MVTLGFDVVQTLVVAHDHLTHLSNDLLSGPVWKESGLYQTIKNLGSSVDGRIQGTRTA